jgi:hypothetical protein
MATPVATPKNYIFSVTQLIAISGEPPLVAGERAYIVGQEFGGTDVYAVVGKRTVNVAGNLDEDPKKIFKIPLSFLVSKITAAGLVPPSPAQMFVRGITNATGQLIGSEIVVTDTTFFGTF